MQNKIEILKKLREETGLGMNECKEALEEVGYDHAKAVTLLREKGKNIATKKSGRETGQGMLCVKTSDNGISIVELCCETDFVSKGDEFCNLVDKLTDIALESKSNSPEQLLSANNNQGQSIVTEGIAKMGENMNLRRVIFKPVESGVVFYIHNASENYGNMGQIASIITYNAENHEKVKDKIRLLAMHIAATNPTYISREDISAETIEEERKIYTEQVKSSGKPESVMGKIVDGRMEKYYQENVLLEQSFIVDPDLKVKDFIAKLGKENGIDIKITDFVFAKLAN